MKLVERKWLQFLAASSLPGRLGQNACKSEQSALSAFAEFVSFFGVPKPRRP
jgi:hypothetical protein